MSEACQPTYYESKYLLTICFKIIFSVDFETFGEILYRQIAGALAKRIVNYAKKGTQVVQGTDSGFIKFGSRVDLFLPIDTKLDIKLNDVVKGGETIVAINE